MTKRLAAAAGAIAAGVGLSTATMLAHHPAAAQTVAVSSPALAVVEHNRPQPVTTPTVHQARPHATAAIAPTKPATAHRTPTVARSPQRATRAAHETTSTTTPAPALGNGGTVTEQPLVWVEYPSGNCAQIGAIDAQHASLPQIPASECLAGYYEDPNVTPTQPDPNECVTNPTACTAGNAPGHGATATTSTTKPVAS